MDAGLRSRAHHTVRRREGAPLGHWRHADLAISRTAPAGVELRPPCKSFRPAWRGQDRKYGVDSRPVDSFQSGHWRVRSPRALASSASRLSAFPRQWIRPEARTGPPGTERGAAWAQIESRRRDRRNQWAHHGATASFRAAVRAGDDQRGTEGKGVIISSG
jgi:hypothetical protein